MALELTPTGICAAGDIPWGTHFCCFYESKQSLVDTLIAFFQQGLENGEFCLWVVCDPIKRDEAEIALRRAVPDLDRYLAHGNIEIRGPSERFLQGAAFGPDGVVQFLHDNLEQALASGRTGMRVAGSPALVHGRQPFPRI